jgi:hypothetical protein
MVRFERCYSTHYRLFLIPGFRGNERSRHESLKGPKRYWVAKVAGLNVFAEPHDAERSFIDDVPMLVLQPR